MKTIQEINALLSNSFESAEELLAFYQKELPGRIGNFRLDEVGPIMSIGSDEEVAGYLEQRFSFNGCMVEMPGKIDWYAAPDGDLEWNGGFVRQGYFMYLADRYEATGDEIYAETIISHMLDYIRSVPPYDPEGKPYLEYKKSTWRPFEAAGRAAENWPVALKKIISSKAMTAERFAEIFCSIYEHTVFLRKHHWQKGNHACLEVAGLGVLSIFYQEFSEAEAWRKYAVEVLMSKIDEQFSDDGYTREMSGAYHWVAMRNFLAFYLVAKNNGMEDIFPDTYKNVIYRAAWAEFYQQKPDYSLPVTNDSNVTTRHQMQLELLKTVIDQDVVDYRLCNGKKGKAPEHVSYFYPDAKLAVMRSDWSKDALYASFDMGPWGINHMNEDQLNLEVSAYGRNLLVNSGRWRYTTSPGISWLSRAQYFRNTPSYNSVICDGMGQAPGDADGFMLITEAFDYAKGTFNSGYGKESETQTVSKEPGSMENRESFVTDVTHIREVFFAKKEGFFLVRDTMNSKEEHRYTQIWHMADGTMKKCQNGYLSEFEDANLVILQLNQPEMEYFCGSEEPFKGWNCPSYDHMVPAPEVDVHLSGTGPVVFETLLFPVKGKADAEHLPEFKKIVSDEGVVYTVSVGRKTTSVLAGEQWKLL